MLCGCVLHGRQGVPGESPLNTSARDVPFLGLNGLPRRYGFLTRPLPEGSMHLDFSLMSFPEERESGGVDSHTKVTV